MEWINVIVTAVVAIISALGGGGLMYLRQNRREKDINNELREADEWEKLYHEKERKCDQKDVKIDELRKHINALQEERIKVLGEKAAEAQALRGEIAALNTKMVECNWYRCEVCGCAGRKPPRDIDVESC